MLKDGLKLYRRLPWAKIKVKHHFLECASTCSIPEKWLLIIFGLAFKKKLRSNSFEGQETLSPSLFFISLLHPIRWIGTYQLCNINIINAAIKQQGGKWVYRIQNRCVRKDFAPFGQIIRFRTGHCHTRISDLPDDWEKMTQQLLRCPFSSTFSLPSIQACAQSTFTN